MAGPIHTTHLGVQDSAAVRAVSRISPNVRVQATTGLLGTVADSLQFPGPSVIGQWIVPNQRCLVGGVPSIGTSSAGLAFSIVLGAPVPTGPMLLVQPDSRVTAF